MKKRTFRCATQMGAKLLFSLLALLLVLTGCNVPTPPQEQVTTGTEQPTDAPTEQLTEAPTEAPTELPTEQETQPEPVEARYDIFLSLLEKSYTEKQEFVAGIYTEALFDSGYLLDIMIENGQIYLMGDLYKCTYVEDFTFEYADSLLMLAKEHIKPMLDRMQNQKGYYILQDKNEVQNGDIIIIVEIDNALYFLTIHLPMSVIGRIHVIHFE